MPLALDYDLPISILAGSGATAELVTFAYAPDRQRWQQHYAGNGMSETTRNIGRLLELVAN